MKLQALLIFTALTVALSLPSNAATFGKWRTITETNKATTKTDYWISTRATKRDSQYSFKRPFMGVDCASFYYGDLDILGNANITTRTNSEPKGRNINANMWQDSSGVTVDLFLWDKRDQIKFWTKEYKVYFENMRKDNKMYVSFNSY